MVELSEIYGALASTIPQNQNSEPGFLSLSEANLPRPPKVVSITSLCITRGYHFYNDTPVDQMAIEIDRPTCAHLGLLILSCLFHPDPKRTVVRLTHKRSTIKELRIDYDWTANHDYPGYVARPFRFNFYPQPQERHPWLYTAIDTRELPIVTLTNRDEMITSHEQLSDRDVALGFGCFRGAALFAELLLNASLNDSPELEYRLEGELGVRGVGPGSSELTLWLPGGLGYLDAPPVV
ncbi:MAG: hypothetical protein AAFQ76_09695 [Cyanobacteria bacterium J06626_26]